MPLTRNYSQRNTSWNAPYTFSGKEKDVETGYGYFGARYYDSGLSIWLSVDPMSDKYPSMSPYNYCANNPVILVDPDGRIIKPAASFKNTKHEKVHNYLFKNNSNYYNALSLFIPVGKFNLTLEVNPNVINDPKAPAQTDPRYTYNSTKNTTSITSTQSYRPTENGSPITIFDFYLAIHELGHTINAFSHKDVIKNVDGNSHNGYTSTFETLSKIWSEFSSDNNLNLSNSQIKDLCFWGAEESDAFISYMTELA